MPEQTPGTGNGELSKAELWEASQATSVFAGDDAASRRKMAKMMSEQDIAHDHSNELVHAHDIVDTIEK